jgi:hypothetical protein
MVPELMFGHLPVRAWWASAQRRICVTVRRGLVDELEVWAGGDLRFIAGLNHPFPHIGQCTVGGSQPKGCSMVAYWGGLFGFICSPRDAIVSNAARGGSSPADLPWRQACLCNGSYPVGTRSRHRLEQVFTGGPLFSDPSASHCCRSFITSRSVVRVRVELVKGRLQTLLAPGFMLNADESARRRFAFYAKHAKNLRTCSVQPRLSDRPGEITRALCLPARSARPGPKLS